MTDLGKCASCGAVLLRANECPALCSPPPSPAPKYKGPAWVGLSHMSRLGRPVYVDDTDKWIGLSPMILSHHEREERLEARSSEFKSGEISEPVYRASLFALRLRGDEIDFAVNANRPER